LDFSSKKILVIGAGKSGTAAAKVLFKRGAEITVCDKRKAEEINSTCKDLRQMDIVVYTGQYPPVKKGYYDLLVVSPGVPLNIVPIREAYNEDIPVISEVELAYLLKAPSLEMYAITGTNGKTTTTSLLQYILAEDGKNSVSGGNIGVPLTTLVDSMAEGVIAVEISSFQLETIRTFRPHICGLLNITPDHLDRHKTMQSYIEAKARIFLNQTASDYVILNYEDNTVRNMAQKCRSQVIFFSAGRTLKEGVFIEDNIITAAVGGCVQKICDVGSIPLRGKHNLENALCAAAMAVAAGTGPEIIRRALMAFPGVRHRMEEVLSKDGILYINDSKATNPDSVIKALESFDDPVILIAGGRNKGAEFLPLAQVIKKRVKELVLVGEARAEIRAAVAGVGFGNIHEAEDFASAVTKAHELAEKGDVVLLSPACASWDMFESYEHRGDCFCQLVRHITRGNS